MAVEQLRAIPATWEDPIFTPLEAENRLRQPYHVLFAVASGGHLFASLVPGMPADILTLYVPPAVRRNGHAKALVEAAIAAARHTGCTGLTLEVSAENAAAIALYTVCGLQQVGKRQAYYPSNPPHSVSNLKADALVLALTFA